MPPFLRDNSLSMIERARHDTEFAFAMLDEAVLSLANGEPEVTRIILRDMVKATIGFDLLSISMAKPKKSVQRMLTPKANPSMDNISAILYALRKHLKVGIKVKKSKKAAK